MVRCKDRCCRQTAMAESSLLKSSTQRLRVLQSPTCSCSAQIAHQMVRDLRELGGKVDVFTVPNLCPPNVSPYDFSRADQLIETGR